MSEYTEGQYLVTESGDRVCFMYGPYRDSFDAWVCLVRRDDPNGSVTQILDSALSPIPPEDPRVEKVARALYNQSIYLDQECDVWWDTLPGAQRVAFLDAARAALAALDAMPVSEETRKPLRIEADPNSTGALKVEAVAKALHYLEDRGLRNWENLHENSRDTYRIDAGYILAGLDSVLEI